MPFCRQCGQQVTEDADFCSSCGAKQLKEQPKNEGEPLDDREIYQDELENDSSQYFIGHVIYEEQREYDEDDDEAIFERELKEAKEGVFGIGTALFSFFSSIGAMVLVIIAIIAAVSSPNKGLGSYSETAVFFSSIALLSAAISVFCGISSIQNYTKAKNVFGTNPVATLIFGIVGFVLTGISSILIPISFVL